MSEMSIIIPSAKPILVTLLSANLCPFRHEIIPVYGEGIGFMRNLGAKLSQYKQLVMVDDDLWLSPSLWCWLACLKDNEFAMAIVGEHVASRVFSVMSSAFWDVGGFDPSIRFMFEDGDFYVRALENGLKFKPVPSCLFRHIEHSRPLNDVRKLVSLDWDYARMFVKHRRHVKRNMLDFFIHPFDYHTILIHLLVKILATYYWSLKKIVKKP